MLLALCITVLHPFVQQNHFYCIFPSPDLNYTYDISKFSFRSNGRLVSIYLFSDFQHASS
uniref:Uncharacterized protein n=1 Tax=Oryza brachyantha TaxID=4533 RepID=J3N611_ORYBR